MNEKASDKLSRGCDSLLHTVPTNKLYLGRLAYICKNKSYKKVDCSVRSMEVKLPSLIGNYDRRTDERTDGLIGKFHFQKECESQ